MLRVSEVTCDSSLGNSGAVARIAEVQGPLVTGHTEMLQCTSNWLGTVFVFLQASRVKHLAELSLK